MSQSCCQNVTVEIATLRHPATFSRDTCGRPIVIVGPIRSLPSGVVEINFNPWPYENPDCRLDVLDAWANLKSIVAYSPRTHRSVVYDCASFPNIGRLVINTCQVQRLTNMAENPFDVMVTFTFFVDDTVSDDPKK